MTHFDLGMDGGPVFWSGVFQGFGVGIAYVPMAALAFATLSPELRNEGTALFSLVRNIGSSVGIALVQALLARNLQIVHAGLAGHVTPYNLASRDPALAAQIAAPQGRALLEAGLSRQATMIAYLDDFKLMLLLILLAMPLLLLVRPVRPAAAKEEAAYAAIE
jgi:DHA2 family multidrug resistance protein